MADSTKPNGDSQTTRPQTELHNYTFPRAKLQTLRDETKTPLVFVSCGSFNPITVLHLRMTEMAQDWARRNTDFEVVGRYLSPVGDAYGKAGLQRADYRVEMCKLAAQGSNIEVDDWEAVQQEYQPTAQVLDHFDDELNVKYGGAQTHGGKRKPIHIALLAGADLIQTMSTPGVWAPEDLDHILGRYGAFIIERAGTDSDAAMKDLQKWKQNIYFIRQLIKNDISSTKVRQALKDDMSVRWLVPDAVIQYIEVHRLYPSEQAVHRKPLEAAE